MKSKHHAKKLQDRVADWQRGVDNTRRPGAPKMELRLETGGYHKPGSNKK